MSELPQIPAKRAREVRDRFIKVMTPQKLRVRFRNADTQEEIVVGGIWNNVSKRYLEDWEIVDLPAKDMERITRQKTPTVSLSQPQWEFLSYCLSALANYERMSEGKAPLQVALLHGARRSGKSVALFAGVLAVAIARPAAQIWVVGLRKRHGQRIINRIRSTLNHRLHQYDKRDQLLRLSNASVIKSKASVNYDSDRGDELDMLALDEAAFQKREVYETLMPSVTSVNGFTALATSPNKRNWIHEINELPKFSDESASAIRSVHLTSEDNIFAPVVAERAEYAKHVMSEERWRQEMCGEFSETSGLALPRFERRIHVKDWSLIDDYTAQVVERFHRLPSASKTGREWIVGVDYNINPTAGAIMKIDTSGQVWICDEVFDVDGTDQFGRRLERHMIDLGCEDPKKEVIIIGDSSGETQDPRNKKTGKSAEILRSQGWTVILPQSSKRSNPLRVDKLEVMRAVHYNAAGDAHMFVDKKCKNIIKMMQYLDLNERGLPNRSNPSMHWFDAVAYAVWRVWGDLYAGKSPGERTFKKPLVDALQLRDFDD